MQSVVYPCFRRTLQHLHTTMKINSWTYCYQWFAIVWMIVVWYGSERWVIRFSMGPVFVTAACTINPTIATIASRPAQQKQRESQQQLLPRNRRGLLRQDLKTLLEAVNKGICSPFLISFTRIGCCFLLSLEKPSGLNSGPPGYLQERISVPCDLMKD